MLCERNKAKVYTEQEDPLKVASVRLSFWHIRVAKKMGDGCFSTGVRNAIEIASTNKQEEI